MNRGISCLLTLDQLAEVFSPPVEKLPATQEYITPEKIEDIRKNSPRVILPVSGDCMEGAGIEDGGMVAVDFTRMPRAPKYGENGYSDPCLCLAVWPGRKAPTVMVKVYDGKWGSMNMVSTRYAAPKDGEDFRMDVGMPTTEIYGVIIASWNKWGKLLWRRDPADFPESLPDEPTVQCGNAELKEVML